MVGRSMGLLKGLASWSLVAAITLVLLETTSAAAVWWLAREPGNEHLARAIERFHPLFHEPEPVLTHLAPHRRSDDANPFRYDSRTGYSNKPNSVYENAILIGPEGFICNGKCDPLPMDKPANEARIMIFGGSSVAGQGAGDGAHTIAGYLERMANQARLYGERRVRVVNAGVGGFYSAQELARFLFEGLLYQPDAVIFFHGSNDYRAWEHSYLSRDLYGPLIRANYHSYDYQLIQAMERMRSLTGTLSHFVALADDYFPLFHYTVTLAKHVRLFGLKGRGGGTTEAAGTARWENGGIPAEAIRSFSVWTANSVSTFVSNDISAAGAARAQGVTALMALQPVLLYRRKVELAPAEQELFASGRFATPYIDGYYPLARERWAELASANDGQVEFADLSGLFETVPDHIFTDNVHYTPRGNEIIAAGLLERLQAMRAKQAR
ncbi:MAG: SGNH/GDSL hydrolase family protein [Magnetospirillum sp. WYHS-4]